MTDGLWKEVEVCELIINALSLSLYIYIYINKQKDVTEPLSWHLRLPFHLVSLSLEMVLCVMVKDISIRNFGTGFFWLGGFIRCYLEVWKVHI